MDKLERLARRAAAAMPKKNLTDADKLKRARYTLRSVAEYLEFQHRYASVKDAFLSEGQTWQGTYADVSKNVAAWCRTALKESSGKVPFNPEHYVEHKVNEPRVICALERKHGKDWSKKLDKIDLRKVQVKTKPRGQA